MPNSLRRMPLAYVHIVHVMIHLLLVLAPIALYPKVGALTVLLIPLLTLFYHGLLELAMSFLVTAHSGSNPTHPTHNRLTPYSQSAHTLLTTLLTPRIGRMPRGRVARAHTVCSNAPCAAPHMHFVLDRSDESHARTLVRIGSVWE